MALLTDWYRANKLSLNVAKTVLIEFWSDRKEFSVGINSVKIVNSDKTKFLGLMVDECLSWRDHANLVLNKIKTNKTLLTNAINILDTKSLQNVYHAHIYSHLTYGLVVWGSMIDKQTKDDLHKAQKQCVRAVVKAGARDHTDPIFKKLNTLPFMEMITIKLSKLGYKIHNKILPLPLIRLFDSHGGKKSHQYPTRNKDLPNVQRHVCSKFNNSFTVYKHYSLH